MSKASSSTIYTIRVHRTGAGDDTPSEYQIPVDNPHTRILDLLLYVRQNVDQRLAFRFSCRVGMCGSCAVNVNGREYLACQTTVDSVNSTSMDIRPLRALPTRKDLVSDMDPFFASMKKAHAALEPIDPELCEIKKLPPNEERRSAIEGQNGCITCGACYSACEWTRTHDGYLGPAALNRLYMLALDERDALGVERLKVAADADGALRCHTVGNCSAVCPIEIPIKSGLQRLKSLINKSL
jgi:succinate dehydrogenase / fumarate reductase iron-sulfur subunit/fumarate reductase iron-sulfur subunit